jgi:UDP:flavonoid glycosyltransferase YjiC (YdhE family)
VTGRARLRITVLTLGSRGDVEPLIGLGAALGKAGHQVCVAASAAFAGLIRGAGLEARLVEPEPRLLAFGGEPPRWLTGSAASSAIRLLRPGRTGSRLRAAYSGYLEASRDADLILYPTWLAPVARTAAQVCGSLALPAYSAPIHPTRAFPSPFLSIPSHSRWNRSSHLAALGLWQRALGGTPDAWRSEALGLPPQGNRLLPPDGELCLYGYSPSLLPPPPDWPPGVAVTGPWWLDLPGGWRPPDDLDRFLHDAGEVVFIGFGSIVDVRAPELNAIVEEALSRLECRVVLLTGPEGQLSLPPSPQRIAIRDAPYGWLFSRVDAVVHHGGVGTTAHAARAGKPSVVVPFFGDQFFWGQRIRQAGAGPQPIRRRALTSARLISAIDQTLHDPGIKKRAALLGAQVRAETGLQTAVRLIEERCLE